MATTTDYDAPRTTLTADDSFDDLQARRSAPASSAIDTDESDFATPFVLTDADLPDDEFTVTVVPMMADEFRCTTCFLVWHRSQRETAGTALCRDCS